jgi:hypothetical protein
LNALIVDEEADELSIAQLNKILKVPGDYTILYNVSHEPGSKQFKNKLFPLIKKCNKLGYVFCDCDINICIERIRDRADHPFTPVFAKKGEKFVRDLLIDRTRIMDKYINLLNTKNVPNITLNGSDSLDLNVDLFLNFVLNLSDYDRNLHVTDFNIKKTGLAKKMHVLYTQLLVNRSVLDYLRSSDEFLEIKEPHVTLTFYRGDEPLREELDELINIKCDIMVHAFVAQDDVAFLIVEIPDHLAKFTDKSIHHITLGYMNGVHPFHSNQVMDDLDITSVDSIPGKFRIKPYTIEGLGSYVVRDGKNKLTILNEEVDDPIPMLLEHKNVVSREELNPFRINGKLLSLKIHSFRLDDNIYQENPFLMKYLPRGFTILINASGHKVICRGLPKFFGLQPGDDDDSDQGVFDSIPEPGEFTITMKANGENAQIALVEIDRHYYWIIGSKNAKIILPLDYDLDDIAHYNNESEKSRYHYAMNIAKAFHNVIQSIDRNALLILNDKTMLLEIESPHSQHIVPLTHERLFLISIVDNNTGLEYPRDLMNQVTDLIDIDSVFTDTEQFAGMNFHQVIGYVRNMINFEGVVITFNGTRYKVKTYWYVAIRAIREQCSRFFNKKPATLKDVMKNISHRLKVLCQHNVIPQHIVDLYAPLGHHLAIYIFNNVKTVAEFRSLYPIHWMNMLTELRLPLEGPPNEWMVDYPVIGKKVLHPGTYNLLVDRELHIIIILKGTDYNNDEYEEYSALPQITDGFNKKSGKWIIVADPAFYPLPNVTNHNKLYALLKKKSENVTLIGCDNNDEHYPWLLFSLNNEFHTIIL